MQRKPIANKYRKGMMKSTLQARMLQQYYFISIYVNIILLLFCIHAPKGVKERVKLPKYNFYKKNNLYYIIYNNIYLIHIIYILLYNNIYYFFLILSEVQAD
jgi:hypothetical protein